MPSRREVLIYIVDNILGNGKDELLNFKAKPADILS